MRKQHKLKIEVNIREIARRSGVILFLALLFFVSGLYFFFVHRGAPVRQGDVRPISTTARTAGSYDEEFVLKGMPATSTFQSFIYHTGDVLAVSGACHDMYRTLLVYSASVDYRKFPSNAVYNMATPCRSGESFSVSLSIRDGLLTDGDGYYVIRADQGSTGQWYNPY